jgi:hypothetical protein
MSVVETIGISVTDHGKHRVRKRLGVPARAVERMATKAWFEGGLLEDASAGLRRYVASLNLRGGGRHVRVSQGAVFVFSNGRLLTAWRIPRGVEEW